MINAKKNKAENVLGQVPFKAKSFENEIKAVMDYKPKSKKIMTMFSNVGVNDAKRSVAKVNMNESFLSYWMTKTDLLNFRDVTKNIYKAYLINIVFEAEKLNILDKPNFNEKILPDLKKLVERIDKEAYGKLLEGKDELDDKSRKDIAGWLVTLLSKKENLAKLAGALKDAEIGSYENIQAIVTGNIFNLGVGKKLDKKSRSYHEIIADLLNTVVKEGDNIISMGAQSYVETFGKKTLHQSSSSAEIRLRYIKVYTNEREMKEFTAELDNSQIDYTVKGLSVIQYQSFSAAQEVKDYVDKYKDSFRDYNQVDVLNHKDQVIIGHRELMNTTRFSPQ